MEKRPYSAAIDQSVVASPSNRWLWAILSPYLLIAAGVGLVLLVGSGDANGLTPRSPLALLALLSAVLAHVGLYVDARRVRATGGGWTPHYKGYALGGAVVALLALLILDVTTPGGPIGTVLLAVGVGILLAAPLYLARRLQAHAP